MQGPSSSVLRAGKVPQVEAESAGSWWKAGGQQSRFKGSLVVRVDPSSGPCLQERHHRSSFVFLCSTDECLVLLPRPVTHFTPLPRGRWLVLRAVPLRGGQCLRPQEAQPAPCAWKSVAVIETGCSACSGDRRPGPCPSLSFSGNSPLSSRCLWPQRNVLLLAGGARRSVGGLVWWCVCLHGGGAGADLVSAWRQCAFITVVSPGVPSPLPPPPPHGLLGFPTPVPGAGPANAS